METHSHIACNSAGAARKNMVGQDKSVAQRNSINVSQERKAARVSNTLVLLVGSYEVPTL